MSSKPNGMIDQLLILDLVDRYSEVKTRPKYLLLSKDIFKYFSARTTYIKANRKKSGNFNFQDFVNLRHLCLKKCTLRRKTFKMILEIKKLKVLDLSGCKNMRDSKLKIVSKVLVLEELNISRCRKVKGEGLKEIAKLKGLKVLDLSQCDVSDAALSCLVGLSLVELKIAGCEDVTDVGMKEICKMDLKRLNVSHCTKIEETGFMQLSACKSLTDLDVSDTRFKDIAYLNSLCHLQCLNLSGCFVTDSGLENILTLKHMNHLHLARCSRVTEGALLAIFEILKLKTLKLPNGTIVDSPLKIFQGRCWKRRSPMKKRSMSRSASVESIEA